VARSPSALALAHFGVLPDAPGDALVEADDALREWAGVAERAWEAGEPVAEALERAFGASHAHVETLNGIHSNASGLGRWLEQRGAPPTP
jgi:hypothetical protein